MRLRAVAESNVWPYFILNLLCFVTTAVWVTWPLLSAGVDDHSRAVPLRRLPHLARSGC